MAGGVGDEVGGLAGLLSLRLGVSDGMIGTVGTAVTSSANRTLPLPSVGDVGAD